MVLGLELGRGFLSHGSCWSSLTDTDAKDDRCLTDGLMIDDLRDFEQDEQMDEKIWWK